MAAEWVTAAGGAIAVARLERAANALARAAHPGVVEFVAYNTTGLESAELRTVRVDAPTLADQRLRPEELAGVVAAVAATLADLHARDVVHGAIESRHILLPAGSGPRLCSFGGDPAAQPHDDVAALGRLLAAGSDVRSAGDEGQEGQEGHDDALERLREDLPRGRFRVWARQALVPTRGRGRADGAHEAWRAVADIARQATDPDPTRRPSAHALAAMLRDRVPDARLPGDETDRTFRNGRRLGRGRGAAAATALVKRLALVGLPVMVLGVAVLVVGAVVPRRSAEVAPAPAPTPGATSTTGSGPAAVQLWPRDNAGCAAVSTPLRGDVDGDGCDEALAFADGVLISDSARLAVGSADDVAATGDWDCDGRATLVLLRRARGTVWHFETWPRPGDAVEGRLIAQETDAVALVAHADEDQGDQGCDQLEIGLAGGGGVSVNVNLVPNGIGA